MRPMGPMLYEASTTFLSASSMKSVAWMICLRSSQKAPTLSASLGTSSPYATGNVSCNFSAVSLALSRGSTERATISTFSLLNSSICD